MQSFNNEIAYWNTGIVTNDYSIVPTLHFSNALHPTPET